MPATPLKIRRNPYFRIATRFASDARHNRRLGPVPHVLIVRDLHVMGDYNYDFLGWVAQRHPKAARHLRLARISRLPVSTRGVGLLVPWLQDPLRELYPRVYERARRLEDRCGAAGAGVVNAVEALSNSVKSRALELIGSTGIRTARVAPLSDPLTFDPAAHGLDFPLLVREDRGHGGPMLRVDDRAAFENIVWDRFRHPIAMEWIDTRSDDGFYRKYRYVAIGESGVPRHMFFSRDWTVRLGAHVDGDAHRREELEYALAPDPNQARFDRARRALGLDIVAFDYGYDQEGELVVWEPNPLAVLWSAHNDANDCAYQAPVVERLYTMLLTYYLRRAGLGPG